MNRPTNEVLGRLCFLAKTQGIIPDPVNAVRIRAGNAADGNVSATVYSVPVGMIAYISNASLDSVCGATLGSTGMRVKNKAGAVQYYIHFINFAAANTHDHAVGQFIPALELSAEWYIEVYGTVSGQYVRGDVFGWLESV